MNLAVERQRRTSGDEGEVAIGMNLDVTDLFYYYASSSTPTGIQRVQQELCLELEGRGMECVVYDKALQRWRIAPAEWLQSLIDAARSFRPGNRPWTEVYQEFAAESPAFPAKHFEPGEWLVNVGASWSLPGYFMQVRQLRRQGVRHAVFVHDCIPARHPAYFDQALSIEFTHWLANVRETADLAICNSEATRNDYLDLVQPEHPEDVHVCRLAASWAKKFVPPQGDAAATELLEDIGALDHGFVLTVGTIEPRKNHLTLVHVWDKLRTTHPTSCPKLLCVGKIGWKSDAVMSQAKALGLLNSKIHFVSGLSDDTVQALYRKCLFTVFVSYYEGWGLPISESLAAGKLCIAGSNSSLKEAGAGFALHVDERSETSIHDAIARLLDRPAELTAANAKVRCGYDSESWSTIAAELAGIIAAGAAKPPRAIELPELQMGTYYRFGRPEPLKQFDRVESAEPFCSGQAWYKAEEWGAWTSKDSAELAFRISTAHERPAIFLGMKSPPGAASVTIAVNGNEVVPLSPFAGRKRRIVKVPLDVDRSGVEDAGGFVPVRLRITSTRVQDMRQVPNSTDVRMLGIGYLFLLAFDQNSISDRLECMEKIITNDLG